MAHMQQTLSQRHEEMKHMNLTIINNQKQIIQLSQQNSSDIKQQQKQINQFKYDVKNDLQQIKSNFQSKLEKKSTKINHLEAKSTNPKITTQTITNTPNNLPKNQHTHATNTPARASKGNMPSETDNNTTYIKQIATQHQSNESTMWPATTETVGPCNNDQDIVETQMQAFMQMFTQAFRTFKNPVQH